jgi:chromate transporter
MAASLAHVFAVALRLGLTSFGGPVAHLGYFRTEYVQRRRWLDDEAYAEIVALAQVLPGPASSQVGFAVGMTQRGLAGGVAAWVGFTVPSAVALAAFGALAATAELGSPAWLTGLKVVAVAVVADAVLGMARRLAATARTAALAVGTFAAAVLVPSALTQVAALAAAGLVALVLLRDVAATGPLELPLRTSRRVGVACLTAFALLLVGLPVLASTGLLAELAAIHYRAGALVFGGGHVVLPLLEEQVVPGYLDSDTFLAGYGMAQAVPGPLFTFAAYLGQVIAGVPGAAVATVFIFVPGLLLLLGVLPFWTTVRSNRRVQSALVGVNAGVVGILGAALYDPIITSTLVGPAEVVLAVALFVALHVGRLPPWAVVLAGLAASPLFAPAAG